MVAIPWQQAGWRDEAIAWIEQVMAQHSRPITGEIETIHERAWSIVFKIPSGEDFYFFKAALPGVDSEIPLTAELSALGIPWLPRVLGADAVRGWLLLADAGEPMRKQIQSTADFALWKPVLAQYVALQKLMIPKANEYVARGLAELRDPDFLPQMYVNLLETRGDLLLVDQPNGITSAEYEQAKNAVPRVQAVCDALANDPIPLTLHHDDFHASNVWVKDSVYTIADWGEACITHPFCSMLIVGRATSYYVGLDLGTSHPEIDDLYRFYLEQWHEYGTVEELWPSLQAALKVGRLHRLFSWANTLTAIPTDHHGDEADAVSGWLQNCLEVL